MDMQSLKRLDRLALALLAALALTAGCEDSGVIAPSDGQMIVTANPTTVEIDEAADPPEGQSTITAQLFDASGFALQGVDVLFRTSDGSLASSPPGQEPTAIETDANGVARDVLTLSLSDDDTVEVTASSGTLSGSVQVTKSSGNQPPEAIIDADPADEQAVDAWVTFDGSASSDPDGAITCYKWTISGASTEVVQGTSATIVSRRYTEAQALNVVLRVSDLSDSATWCNTCTGGPATCGADDSWFNGFQDSIAYDIVCDLTGPVAAAGPDQIAALSGGQALVPLDGSASRDAESGIVSYSWQCGNGTAALQGAEVTCTYTATGIYTARLTVTNGCDMVGTDDARVTVSSP